MEKEMNPYIKQIKPHLFVVSFRAVALGMVEGVVLQKGTEGRLMHILEDGTVYINNDSEFYLPTLRMFTFLMEQPKYKLNSPDLAKRFLKRYKLKEHAELERAFQSILELEQKRRKIRQNRKLIKGR